MLASMLAVNPVERPALPRAFVEISNMYSGIAPGPSDFACAAPTLAGPVASENVRFTGLRGTPVRVKGTAVVITSERVPY